LLGGTLVCWLVRSYISV